MPTHKAFTHQPDTWWDPKGPFWTLHAINPLRLSFILKHANGGHALDIGCGGGILSEALLPYFSVTGIDRDQDLLTIAKSRDKGVTYHHGDLQDLKTNLPSPFDLVTCLEVLEHVDDPACMVQDMLSLLKPGGILVISTLNRNIISFLGAIVAAEYILKIIPKHTHEYQKFITPDEIIAWATPLKLKDIQGIHYNPIKKRFSLGNQTLINYIMALQKPSL